MTQHRRTLIIWCVVVYLLPAPFYMALGRRSAIFYLAVWLISGLFPFLGYYMTQAVIGVQVRYTAVRLSPTAVFCKAAFFFFVFVGMIWRVASLCWLLVAREELVLAGVPCGYGMAYAAYVIHRDDIVPRLVPESHSPDQTG